MSITIQVGVSGYLTALVDGDTDESIYPIQSLIFKPSPGGGGYFSLKVIGEETFVFERRLYSNIINGDTGLAFASVAALKAYIKTNFFRKAGNGTGTLSASNFILENPVGTINGINTIFVISFVAAIILAAWRNGAAMAPSEYSVSGTQLTYTTAPTAGPPFDDILLILYIK